LHEAMGMPANRRSPRSRRIGYVGFLVTSLRVK
jgi:hypothetical protein